MRDDDIECMTAGNHPSNELTVHTVSACGRITDGIAFSFAQQGAWVMAFKDLEAIYLAAKRRREAMPERSAAEREGK